MNRRQIFQVTASTALAHGVVTVLGCGAAGPKTADGPAPASPKTDHPPIAVSPVTAEMKKASVAALRCAVLGETCLEHCIRSLSSGSTMMAECAKSVQQMIALCRAVASLAAMGSPFAKEVAAVCARACAECRSVCEKHAGHHVECKECAESCAECETLCLALARA